MTKNAAQWLFFAATLLSLGACQPANSDAMFTKGTVVSMGKTHLILDDGHSVMFLAVAESDKQRLKDLKKGDKVTLVGKKVPDDERSVDIEEIITPDGSHVQLGV